MRLQPSTDEIFSDALDAFSTQLNVVLLVSTRIGVTGDFDLNTSMIIQHAKHVIESLLAACVQLRAVGCELETARLDTRDDRAPCLKLSKTTRRSHGRVDEYSVE